MVTKRWISWPLVMSRDSKSLVWLQRYSMPLACLLSLMEKVSRDKRVHLQIWFAKRHPSLAQLQQQTDMHQDPRSRLIKHLLYSDSKSSFPPAQHLGQTTTLYLNSAAQIPVLWSHEYREQEGRRPIDHSPEHMVDVYHCRHIKSYGNDGIKCSNSKKYVLYRKSGWIILMILPRHTNSCSELATTEANLRCLFAKAAYFVSIYNERPLFSRKNYIIWNIFLKFTFDKSTHKTLRKTWVH